MEKLEKLWYQTRDRRYTMRDKIKNFLWMTRHPFLAVRFVHYALNVLTAYGVDIEDVRKRN